MKLILPVFILCILSSCAEHQYLTISGTNIDKTDTHNFVSEGDTVTVLYHFRPDQGKVYIKVFNETDQPIVIDWWKSAIIVGNNVFSYYRPDAALSAQLNSTVTSYGKGSGTLISSSNVNGSVVLNESSQFIPSHAEIAKEMLVFRLDTIRNLPERQAVKDTIHISYSDAISYRKMSFAKDQSPLTFRSYLTFRIGRTGEEREFSKEHEFYVSEVWKIRYQLQELPSTITSRGDMIYLAP